MDTLDPKGTFSLRFKFHRHVDQLKNLITNVVVMTMKAVAIGSHEIHMNQQLPLFFNATKSASAAAYHGYKVISYIPGERLSV